MERERLDRLVSDPDLVGRGDLADLQALTERFPWFAGAQVLRSLGEHRMGDVLSEETLRTSVAHLPSRTRLFDLVHAGHSQAPLKIVPQEEPMTLAPVTLPEAPSIDEPERAPGPPAPSIGTPHEQAVPEGVPVPDEQVVIPPTDSGSDILERQILEAAMASAYDLTGLEAGTPPISKQQAAPRVAEESTTDGAMQRRPFRGTDRLSFTEWLGMTADAGAPGTTPATPMGGGPSMGEAADRVDPVPAREGSPHVKKESMGKGSADTVDLIDRFISQQSPPVVPKTEFYTPQQAAKRSLDDTAGLVTETLARVYAKQGNLPKAIDAYHRLALKYPDKSAYFAALAKELEIQQHK